MNDLQPCPFPTAAAVAGLASQQLTRRTHDRVSWTQRRFTAWASSHGLPSLPCSEQTLIRWLHTQAGQLAPPTLRAYADAVRTAHRRAGLADPGGPRLAAYLTAMRRNAARAGTLRQPRVIAVDLRDVVERVDAPLARTDPGGELLHLRARTALLLGRACQAPLRQLTRLELHSLDLDGDELSLRLPATSLDPARRVRLTRQAHALCPVTAVAEYLPHLPAGTTRLLGVVMRRPGPGCTPVPVAEPTPAERSHRVLETSLRKAARRAGLDLALSPYPAAGMSDADLEWMLPFLNWQRLLQLRNRAYVLLGLAQASRADELNRLTVGDVLARPDGLDVLVASSKTDPEGRGMLLNLAHEEEDPSAGCLPHCPIGALLRWTSTMTRLWDVGHSHPLFPSMRAGEGTPTGTLSTADGSRILQQVLGRTDVSSRTMRASTITALRAENEPLHRIAEVSRHKDLAQLARYLRILDPHADQYHLPV